MRNNSSWSIITGTLAVFAIIAIAGLISSCSDTDSNDNKTEMINNQQQSPHVAASASLSARDIDGNLRYMSEWIGKKPVILNVWGTWCPPCRREIPELVRLYKEYKPKGVEIVSMAVRDTPEKVRNFTQQAGMDWVMLMVDLKVLEHFSYSNSVPTTIFFDKNGYEVARFIGARDYNTFKSAFEKLVSSS